MSVSQKEKLCRLIPEPEALDSIEKDSLMAFLANHHQALCLDDNERGETDLLQFEMDTGDTPHSSTVRQEVAWQLKNMQDSGVAQSLGQSNHYGQK